MSYLTSLKYLISYLTITYLIKWNVLFIFRYKSLNDSSQIKNNQCFQFNLRRIVLSQGSVIRPLFFKCMLMIWYHTEAYISRYFKQSHRIAVKHYWKYTQLGGSWFNDDGLTWSNQKTIVHANCQKLFILRHLRKTLNLETLKNAVFTMLHSLLEYGKLLWRNSSQMIDWSVSSSKNFESNIAGISQKSFRKN